MPTNIKEDTSAVNSLLFTSLFIAILATIHSGVKVIYLIATAIISCVTFDLISQRLLKRERKLNNATVLSGVIIAFLLPVDAPVYFCIIGAAFAILVVKYPFGGDGANIFNPAAGGLAFLAVSYPKQFFDYPGSSNNVLNTLKEGHYPQIEKLNFLIGNQVGPIGVTQTLLLLACLVFLCQRKAISKYIVWPFLTTCTTIAFLFPRAAGYRIESVFFEISSGMLLFSAIYIFTDPVTAPKYKEGKILYGIFAATLTMLLRYFGHSPDGTVFAVLCANSLPNTLDAFVKKCTNKKNYKGIYSY
jgi:electron transport complex protein RnfD